MQLIIFLAVNFSFIWSPSFRLCGRSLKSSKFVISRGNNFIDLEVGSDMVFFVILILKI